MGTYFYLQCKRIARWLPGAFCAMLVLLSGLLAAFSVMMDSSADAEENQKIQIALVGTAEDSFLQLGLAALQTYDSTQFSMELVEMTEQEAHAALERGQVGAYVVIPEGFAQEALSGHILPLKFVSTTGAATMVSVFKEEVTEVISTLLMESQRGVYGMQAAMKSEGIGGRGSHMNALAVTYVEYILARDHTYSLQSLGISDALGLEGYLLCGLAVLLLMLSCLSFAPVMIRRDLALERVLASRGQGVLGQCLCDLLAYCLALLAMTAAVLAAAAAVSELKFSAVLVRAVPVVLLCAAWSYLLYALATDLIGGVLLQFFATAALCFVSGCMYPVYFFPVAVQRFATWLPTSAARSILAGCITGETDPQALGLLLGYTALLCLTGIAVRARRVKEARL